MRFELYADPTEFYQAALPLLFAHEAENNIILGIGACLAENRHYYSENDPVVGLASMSGAPCGVVLMTPPRNMLLTRMPQELAEYVASELADAGIALPGVMVPQETVAAFIGAWSERTGQRAQFDQTQCIYQLDQVSSLPVVPGYCASATMDDYELLRNWLPDFLASVGEPLGDIDGRVRYSISASSTYLWKTDAAVSMAAIPGGTPNGSRIGMVYTPPEYRGRGYATAHVAALSQQILDAGKRFCFLSANLANPAANRVYQKIGFLPVCDVDTYRVVRPDVI